MSSQNIFAAGGLGPFPYDASAPTSDDDYSQIRMQPCKTPREAAVELLRVLLERYKEEGYSDIDPEKLITLAAARTNFMNTAIQGAWEMTNAIQLLHSLPMCQARALINRRILRLLGDYIKMLDHCKPWVTGEELWDIDEARPAVYIIGQIMMGFNHMWNQLKEVESVPRNQLERYGNELKKICLELWPDEK